MGSKRSAKVPSEKKDDDEAKKLQQKRMSWKLKYELINSDQLFVNGNEEGKNSSGEEEQQERIVQFTEKNKLIEEEKKTDVKKKESKQKTTVLAGLSGYLSSSDSDDSESSDQEPDIQVEVRAFLKEVDGIKLDSSGNPIEEAEVKKEEQKRSSESAAMDQQQQAMREYYASHGYTMPTSSWQECYDSSSGYSYYWNIDTNEVRWDIPTEYQVYIATVKRQWEEYNRALYANQYRSTSSMALNQSAGNSAAGSVPIMQAALSESVSNKDAAQSALRHSQTQIPGAKSVTPGKVRKRPSHLSDSEDEKIELITSYGPNSDDQSSEDDSQINEAAKTKKKKKHSLDSKSKNLESGHVIKAGANITAEELEKQEEIKKKLASRQEDVKKLLAIKKEEALRNKKRLAGSTTDGPSNKKQAVESELISTVSNAPSEEQQNVLPVPCKPDLPSDNVPSPGEFELVERLKSQAEVLKQLGGELPEGVYNIISDNSPKIENDASLVPGYEENADSESDEKEFIDEDSNESKSVKSEISEENNSKNMKDDVPKQDGKQVAAAGERVSKRVLKLSAKAKQLINASETTKRARQTDFVSTPLGLRPANSAEIVSDQNVEEKASLDAENDTQRLGLGYFEDTADTSNANKIVKFVSGGSTKDSDSVDSGSDVDIEDCKEVLMGKMKFLSEGKEAPSPVQIWAEQLEILYKAWEGKWLKDEFLSRWLQNISERLTQLESTAAPPGWLCLWSREERRYCYKRVETGEVVWDFPVATLEEPAPAGSPADNQTKPGEKEDITDLGEGQGEIEMDLCMTPPPPSTPPSPPPPPVISIDTPSPPPPPVISYPPDKDENVPPLPEDIAPPLPEEAPPPLPEEAPPLPLDDVPPLPPGEPLPPGLEPPHPELSFTPPLPPAPSTPPIPAIAPPHPHRTLLPHPTPQDYSHIVMTPATYHHMAYHPIQHYGTQSQYSSAYVSAAPMPAQIPAKLVEAENKPSNLSSELNSFYSDLATLEPEETEEPSATGVGTEETPPVASQDSPEPPPTSSSPDPNALKKRKKTKLAPGLALKKKGVSSLVAKWQKVQQNSRRDF